MRLHEIERRQKIFARNLKCQQCGSRQVIKRGTFGNNHLFGNCHKSWSVWKIPIMIHMVKGMISMFKRRKQNNETKHKMIMLSELSNTVAHRLKK